MTIARSNVTASAAGNASHTPVIPRNVGSTSAKIMIAIIPLLIATIENSCHYAFYKNLMLFMFFSPRMCFACKRLKSLGNTVENSCTYKRCIGNYTVSSNCCISIESKKNKIKDHRCNCTCNLSDKGNYAKTAG